MKQEEQEGRFALHGCNWELTLRCTLNCIHCGSRAGAARSAELGLEACFRVADELVALGCRELTLIGGEVFLFRGWEELGAYLTDCGVSVNLISNGYQLGDREVEQILRSKVVNVGLSIDGMAGSHNRIRGRADSFSRIESAIGRLHGANVPVCAVTSVMKENFDDLEELYHFLEVRDVRVWQLQLVSAMGNAKGRHDLLVTPAQVAALTGFIRDRNRSGRMLVIAADSIGYYDDNEVWIRGCSSFISCWNGCQAGISSLFIDSAGNVKGCGALYDDRFIEGNLRTQPLAAIWSQKGAFAYNRNFSQKQLAGACRGCEVGDVCRGGCRSSNFFASGNLYENVFCSRNL